MTGVLPIVTLLSDYGTRDGYVGAMKGRVLSIAPNARLVDISHDIAPQDVWQGAWCLRRAVRNFPPGAVHLAVVDPGVGTQRSGLVIETEQGVLVGPDNGLLTLAAQDGGIVRVIEIEEDRTEWRKSESFDGLHLFAPVAAYLAAGMPLEDIGPDADDLVELPDPRAKTGGNVVEGSIVLFDRFGNAITDVASQDLEGRIVERVILSSGVEAVLCDHYAQLAGGDRIGALFNSDGRLELALYGQPLRLRHNLKAGDSVRVLLRPL